MYFLFRKFTIIKLSNKFVKHAFGIMNIAFKTIKTKFIMHFN